jgi:LysR family hydrogen peroxide-inducible transcriptional activator
MDFRQLNALVAVAEHGTFSAADALHTVQSNVSSHVARLERELGATLVDRGAGRLTQEGEVVVARARRVAAELEAMIADVAGLGHDLVGTVRLGMIGTTARWLVPRLLAVMAERHPQVHLMAVEGSSFILEPQLATGGLDLAVVMLPAPGDDLVTEALFDEDLMLVVAADDPLATERELDLRRLAELDLLLPMPGTAFRNELDAATGPAGVELRAKAELDGTRLIASLTFEGLGPSILPATAVPSYLRAAWVMVRVRDLPRRRVGVAQRRRGLLSAPGRAVLEVIHELVASDARPPGVHVAA